VNTKEKLLDVAARLFAERGFDGVSVRDIVREADANLGAVTYHFGGKEQLFAAVINLKTEPLRQVFLEVAQRDLGPREKLSAILLETSMYILNEDPSLKLFFLEAMAGADRVPPDVQQRLNMRNKVVGDIIEEGIAEGVFRSCDVESVTWSFFGMVMPYVVHKPMISPEQRRNPYSEEYVKRIVDAALDIFFQGLEKSK
jgi:AcrR family transcriptional regulator